MSLTNFLNILVVVIALIGGVGAVTFPFYFHFKTYGDWRLTGMSQHVMAYSVVMAALYLSGLIRVFFDGELSGLITRVVLGLGCAIVVWWRFILFARILNEPEPPITAALTARSTEMPETQPPMAAIDEYMLEPDEAAVAEAAPAATPADFGEPDDHPSATHGDFHSRPNLWERITGEEQDG